MGFIAEKYVTSSLAINYVEGFPGNLKRCSISGKLMQTLLVFSVSLYAA